MHLARCSPASQIATTVRTGDTYAWTSHFNTNVTGTANGLNQLTAIGPKSLTHDTKGNVTAFGTKSFTYSSENLLLTGPASTTLGYDPAMRVYQSVTGAVTQRMAYDGVDRIAEYDGSNTLQRRYVHGPNVDEPLVQYEGSGTTDRRFLSSDERGSIISLTDSSGTLLGLNKYDEYGNPQPGNLGVFGYTGQAWMTGLGIWYYKARVYDPELGRFLQTDPIGMSGGVNLYAYVGNDPTNFADPSGLRAWQPPPTIGCAGGYIASYEQGCGAGGGREGSDTTPLPMGAWMWECYGNCTGGYWNTGIFGMLSPSQQAEVIAVVTGQVSFRVIDNKGTKSRVREWIVTNSSRGAVVQEISRTIYFKNGKPRPEHFWEGWPRAFAKWTNGSEDEFSITSKSVSYFVVEATAYYYHGVRLPSYFDIGNVSGAGDRIPSSLQPPPADWVPSAGPIQFCFDSRVGEVSC